MVELDKILSERSDERILKAVRELSDQEFGKLVETVMGYLELKSVKSRPKGTLLIAECVHQPDNKKYIVFFSRKDDPISKPDIESLSSLMKKTDSPSGLVFTTSIITPDAAKLAEKSEVDVADGTRFVALLRRFDLDKEVIKAADLWKERAKTTVVPGADRELQAAMKAGYESLGARDHMKALDSFDRAIMIKEDYDVPWRLKGNTLDEMGYHEQALSCYKRALELFPESDETWFSLGVCMFALGRYNEELVCYDRALQYNPVMQKALINKGSTLHRLGKYNDALETFDKVLKMNYRLERVHNNRGATLHALGKNSDALGAYNKAIELKHDYTEAWMNKGTLLYEQGSFLEAFEAFNQMTQIRPELPKGWYLKGLAARKIGNVSQAKASFEQALRLDAQYSDAKLALEEVSLQMQEKFVEVPRIVKEILTTEAPKPQVKTELPSIAAPDVLVTELEERPIEELADELYSDRAQLLLLMDRGDEAFEYLGKALRLEGENPKLLTAAGTVLYGLGRTEAAVKTFDHAVSADPEHPPALFNLLVILEEKGDLERAAKVAESLRKSKQGWQARVAASLNASSRGEFKQAVEDVDTALALEDLAALQNHKGLLLLESGDMEGAAQVFEKVKQRPLDPSEAYNNSGAVLLKKGDAEKASVEFDKAIRTQRNNHAAWNNRGCVLYKVDRLREAIACFEESSVMQPTTVAMTNKGFTQLSMDLLGDAALTFDQSLKIEETAEAFNNRGIVLERLGKFDDALVEFREAVRISPKFKDAQDNLTRLNLRAQTVPSAPAHPSTAAASPGEKVVGEKEGAEKELLTYTEDILREKRKSELEAICESLELDDSGTRADLIVRILKAKAKLARKQSEKRG
jgi:tetratricopeptide (TPR) repeat protein